MFVDDDDDEESSSTEVDDEDVAAFPSGDSPQQAETCDVVTKLLNVFSYQILNA